MSDVFDEVYGSASVANPVVAGDIFDQVYGSTPQAPQQPLYMHNAPGLMTTVVQEGVSALGEAYDWMRGKTSMQNDEATWGEAIGAAGENAVLGMSSQYWNAVQAANDLLKTSVQAGQQMPVSGDIGQVAFAGISRIPGLLESVEDAHQFAGDITQKHDTAIQENKENLGQVNPWGLKGLTATGIEGMGSMIPAMALSGANPNTMLNIIGTNVGLDKFNEYRDESISFPRSAFGGALTGAITKKIENLFSWADINPYINPSKSKSVLGFLKQLGIGTGKETLLEEPLQVGLETVVDSAVAHKDKTWPEFKQEVGEASYSAFPTSLMMGGLRAPQAARDIMAYKPPQVEPAIPLTPNRAIVEPQVVTPEAQQVESFPIDPETGQVQYDAPIDVTPDVVTTPQIEASVDVLDVTPEVRVDPPPIETVDEATGDVMIEVSASQLQQVVEEQARKGNIEYTRTPRPQPDGSTLAVGQAIKIGISGVVVRPDLFQMREAYNKKGEVRERVITGEMDEAKAGDFLLFIPKDPKAYGLKEGEWAIVVDGHHRHAYFNRVGQENIKGFLLREEDGWTPKLAEAYGAENNIALGNVTPNDVAGYFRKQKKAYGREWAEAQSKRLGVDRFHDSKRIGLDASDSLYRAFQKNPVGNLASVATVIKAYGDDPVKQELYVKAILNGAKPRAIENRIIADKLFDSEEINLLGKDETIIKRATANVIGRLRDEASKGRRTYQFSVLSDYLDPKTKAAVDLDLASQKFDDFTQQKRGFDKLKKTKKSDLPVEQKKEISRLVDQEYDRLEKLKRDSPEQYDIFAQIQADPDNVVDFQTVPKEVEVSGEGEAGATTFYYDLGKVVSWALDKTIRKGKVKAKRAAVEAEFGKAVKTPPEESYLRTLVGKADMYFTTGQGVVDSYGHIPGVISYKLAEERFPQRMAQIAVDVRPFLEFFIHLPAKSQTKVDHAIRVMQERALKQKKKIPRSEEDLKKLGLNDKEIEAAMKVGEATDALLSVVIEEAKKEGPSNKLAKEDQDAYNELLDKYYRNNIHTFWRPMTRGEGKFFIHLKNGEKLTDKLPSDESRPYWGRFATEAEVHAELARLKKEGFDTSEQNLNWGNYIKLDSKRHIRSDSSRLSPSTKVSEMLFDIAPEFGGFKARLMQRQLAHGPVTDAAMAYAEYVSDVAQRVATNEFARDAQKSFDKMPLDQKELRDWVRTFYDYVSDPNADGPVVPKIRSAISYFLLSRPMSGFVNTTQIYTNAIPLAAEYLVKMVGARGLPQAYSMVGRNIKKATHYSSKKARLKTEEGRALQHFFDVDNMDSMSNSFLKAVKEGNPNLLDKEGYQQYIDILGIFKLAEDFNRSTTFLTGYEIAKKQGLKGDRAYEFARQFNKTVNFGYHKKDRPPITRGWAGVPLLYRDFQLNQIKFMADGFKRDGIKSPRAWMHMAHLVQLGGIKAIAGVSEIALIYGLLAGEPWEKKAKEEIPGAVDAAFDMISKASGIPKDKLGSAPDMVESLANAIMVGIPHSQGLLDLQGNMMMQFFPEPRHQEKVTGYLGRLIGGPAGGIVDRWADAIAPLKKGDYYLAAEDLSPPLIRGWLQTARWNIEGDFRGRIKDGETGAKSILEDHPDERAPSLVESIVMFSGGRPSKISNAQANAYHRGIDIAKAKSKEGYYDDYAYWTEMYANSKAKGHDRNLKKAKGELDRLDKYMQRHPEKFGNADAYVNGIIAAIKRHYDRVQAQYQQAPISQRREIIEKDRARRGISTAPIQ